MSPPLILVKHALPVIDPAVPSREWRLGEQGVQDAGRLAGKLAKFAPRRLIASPEPKAEHTARVMGEALGLAADLDPGLVEHKRETVPFGTTETFEASIQALFDRPSERVMGEESADEAYARFAAALGAYPADGLLAVCHGTVITLWVARRFGIAPMPFWKGLGLATAVVVEGDAFHLVAA